MQFLSTQFWPTQFWPTQFWPAQFWPATRTSGLILLTGSLCLMTAGPARAVSFFEVARDAGVDVTYRGLWGGGIALEDFDNDGDIDMALAGGWDQSNRLFENLGDPDGLGFPQFADISESAGLEDVGQTKSVVFADYDNDGLPDLFFFTANNDPSGLNTPAAFKSPVMLYRNNGDGTFTENTAAAGLVIDYNAQAHGSALADVDNDGWLDVYVGNRGYPPGDINYFLHNRGDGTFEDLTGPAGLGLTPKMTLQAGFFDYDNDGDQDIYCATDKGGGNQLFRNNGNLTFTDVSTASGAEIYMDGMCVAAGDCDNDGDLDMFVSNIQDGHAFLINNGNGTFTENAQAAGLLGLRIGWGACWIDFDNDTWPDLYVVAMGPVSQNQLFRNLKNGTFRDDAAISGCADPSESYGLATGDLNLDGNVDLVVSNQNNPLRLFLNGGEGRPSLTVKLIGTDSNWDAVGARLRLQQTATVQTHEVTAGDSYLSHRQKAVIFGLASEAIRQLEISWPSGARQTVTGLEPRGRYRIIEGIGIQTTTTLLGVPSVTRDKDRFTVAWESVPWPDEPRVRLEILAEDGGAAAPVPVAERTANRRHQRIEDTMLATMDPGTYRYRAVMLDRAGAERVLWTSDPITIEATPIPTRLFVGQNFPNPFFATTNIPVRVPPTARQPVLRVFDAAGRRVAQFRVNSGATVPVEIVRGALSPGGRPPAGVYYYQLYSGSTPTSRKMKMILLP